MDLIGPFLGAIVLAFCVFGGAVFYGLLLLSKGDEHADRLRKDFVKIALAFCLFFVIGVGIFLCHLTMDKDWY